LWHAYVSCSQGVIKGLSFCLCIVLIKLLDAISSFKILIE